MSDYILLVFEGEKREKQIFDSLNKFFLTEKSGSILISAYCTDIYTLYGKIKNDSDIDIFVELRSKPQNSSLSGISRDRISEIYLFFDFDGHSPSASHQKIIDMLTRFDDETNHGKLYVSYPMVEAVKHLNRQIPFDKVVFPIPSCTDYKRFVSVNCDKKFNNFYDLSHCDWKIIIEQHCKKLNFIMTNIFEFPTNHIPQYDIFHRQKAKHIDTNNEVAVLSGFPIFIADYYGYSTIIKMCR